MAKVIRQVEIEACDFCGADGGYKKCLGDCGRSACWKCRDMVGKEYNHAVHFQGTGDGFYCSECDAKSTTEQHSLYKKIDALKKEYLAWHSDFEQRAKTAEESLKKLGGKA